MKKLLILLFSILFPLLSSAQKGSVMTPDKKPIAGVLVTLSKTDSTFVKSVATDTDGRFDLMSDVRPYLLSFDHSAYAPKSMRAETFSLTHFFIGFRCKNSKRQGKHPCLYASALKFMPVYLIVTIKAPNLEHYPLAITISENSPPSYIKKS